MRLDHAARLQRLLDRHADVEQVTGSGGETLVRKDQLLVTTPDSDVVHDAALRWIARREDAPAAGVSVFHLRPEAKVDVVALTESLSAGSRLKTANAGPNHILTPGPMWGGGPFDDAAPTAAVPSPPAPDTDVKRAVVVAILDTGIADHPWFNGTAWFASCGADAREVPDADLDYALDSIAGHGTFISGIVLQQAPQATVWPIRVIAGDDVTDELHLLHGLAELRAKVIATGTAVDVVNLSLGCFTHDDLPSPVVEQALRLLSPETVVVACAGNAATNRPFWPAASKRAIAVGSLDATGTQRASFSNYGWWVDASTRGENIVSSFFTFDSEGAHGPQHFTGYATWSGTSFAAPRVAGAIAAQAARDGSTAQVAASAVLNPTPLTSAPDLGVLVELPGSGSS
jgi:subtilisin family serine protease